MHRLLVRTIPRAGDSPVTAHHCAAAHRREALRSRAWFSAEAAPISRVSRVSLPQLPSFVTKEVPHAHYDRWVAALQQSPIFSWRTFHPQPHEPGFTIPTSLQDPKSEQENLALLRRYSEVCEVTKGGEALAQVVEQTHRVVSNLPDKELAGVVSALLAAGKVEEVIQLMDAYKKVGVKYLRPWDVLLEYYFQEKQFAAVESIAQYLVDNQVSSRAAHYIISTHAHAGDIAALQLFLHKYETLIPPESVEFCEEMIRDLLDSPRVPDNWPLSDQMWNLVQRGVVDDVISELQKPGMDRIGVESYSVLVRRLAARVPLDAWRKLQAFVAERGTLDDVEFYNGRIEFGDANLVQEVLRDMDAQGVARNIGTYDALIYVAGVRGDLQECQKLLGEISEKQLTPTSLTFSSVLDYWRSKGNFESAMLFWDEMRRLQITPPPFAHEKLREVTYQYAAKLDQEELQDLYKHVDANDIPALLVSLRSALTPDVSTYNSHNQKMREFRFSSHMPTPQTTTWAQSTTPNIPKSGSSLDGFAEFTYQDGANLTELTNYFEENLQSTPFKDPSLNLEMHLEITTSEVEKYDEMRRTLRAQNKDPTEFLNKALFTFRDYTKRWFNQILLDLAEDFVEFTSEGYSALVHRAWKAGDREECKRLLGRMSLTSIPETEEVAQVRAELFPAHPEQPVANSATLYDLLSELQKPQTALDLQKLQEMAKQIAANLANGVAPQVSHDVARATSQDPHESPVPSASHGFHAHASAEDTAAQSGSPASSAHASHADPLAPSDSASPASSASSASPAAAASPASPADLIVRADSAAPHTESTQIIPSIREDAQKSLPEGTGVSIAELIQRMKETNTMEDRAKVFEFADQQFSEAKVFMFEKMITSCAQEGDLEGSIQIFADMQNHGVRPTAQIYQVVVEALVETENLDGALAHFIAARQADIKLPKLKRTVLNALARTAAARVEAEALHSLVEDMYESDVTPDPEVLYALSINLAEHGDITGSVRILEEIKTAHKLDPDPFFNALVKTLTASRNADHRYKLIEEMAKRGIALNTSTLNTLLYELIREGDVDASLLLVREIRSAGGEIDLLAEHAFSHYFDGAIESANKRDAVRKLAAIVEEVGKGQTWVGLPVYGKLVIKLIYFGDERLALKILADAKHLFAGHSQKATSQAIAKRKNAHAQIVMLVMRASGINLARNASTYAALIRAHMRDGETKKSIALLEEAHRNKHELEAELYDALITTCVKKGDHNSSYKIAEEMGGTMVGLTPTALTVFLRQSLAVKDTQGCADVLLRLRSLRSLTPRDIALVVTRHHNFPQLIEALAQADTQQDNLTQSERDELIAQLTRAHEGKSDEKRAHEEKSDTKRAHEKKPDEKRARATPQLSEKSAPKGELPKEAAAEFGPPSLVKSFDELLQMRGDRAGFKRRYAALCAAQSTQDILARIADLDLQQAKALHMRALSCAILARDVDASIALLRYVVANYGSIYIEVMSLLSRWLVHNFNSEIYDLACQVAAKNATMWNLLLMAMAERNDVVNVATLMQRVREGKVTIYPRTYEQLAALFSRMNNLDACLTLYQHITNASPNIQDTKGRVATVLLRTMIRLQQFEKWAEVLQDLKSSKTPIDVSRLTPLLSDQTQLTQLSELATVPPKAPALKRHKKAISSKLTPTKDNESQAKPTVKPPKNAEKNSTTAKTTPTNPKNAPPKIPRTPSPKNVPPTKFTRPTSPKNATPNSNTPTKTNTFQKPLQVAKVKM